MTRSASLAASLYLSFALYVSSVSCIFVDASSVENSKEFILALCLFRQGEHMAIKEAIAP